jgi:hypothetical protein
MVIVGTITELNTAAYSVNAELYVASGGGMTATPPTARAQPVARVERANANNGAVIVKVNGLSASDATASTLVRRDAIGGSSFVGLNTSTLDSSGITTTGQVEFNGTDAGDSLTFNMVNYFYGTGAASAHRIALGATTTGDALFLAADPAAARTTLGLSLPIAVASGGTGNTNGSAATLTTSRTIGVIAARSSDSTCAASSSTPATAERDGWANCGKSSANTRPANSSANARIGRGASAARRSALCPLKFWSVSMPTRQVWCATSTCRSNADKLTDAPTPPRNLL